MGSNVAEGEREERAPRLAGETGILSPVLVFAAFSPSPVPFIVLMALGFVVGVTGHVYHSRPLVATGIGLIFIATLLLPLALYATE
jgi:hypothetical protein